MAEAKKTSSLTWLVAILIGCILLKSAYEGYVEDNHKESQAKYDKQQLVYFESNKEHLISKLNDMLSHGKYNEIDAMARQFALVTDERFLSITNKAKEKLLVDKVLAIPASNLKDNMLGYKELLDLAPENKAYKDKYEHYHSKYVRELSINSQFSPWDGSHTEFERLIKLAMKNPDSYEHVRTKYWDNGDHIVVETTYRGTNSFNAITTETQRAMFSIKGALIN